MIPLEGDTREDNGKTFVWTKKSDDGHVAIFEWVEQKPPAPDYEDYIGIGDIYFYRIK